MADLVEVRVTMFPSKPIRVTPAEAKSLTRQGLIVVDAEPATTQDSDGDPDAGPGDPDDSSDPAPAAVRRTRRTPAPASTGTE